MFLIEHRDPGWRYWLVTVIFLTAGVAGWHTGFLLAIALTVVQTIHYYRREKSISAFPVQVRIGYLLLLLVALPEPLQLIYWIPVIGTWAQIFFGYCTMARCLSLLPWNREEKFSPDLLRRTFLSRPVRGNILQGLPPA